MDTHEFITENNIIDRYVMGRLSEEERARFEDHFMACHDCMDAMELAQSFHHGVKKQAATHLENVVKVNFMARLLGARAMRASTALLAAAVLFMAFQPIDPATQPVMNGAVQVVTLESVRGAEDDPNQRVEVRPGDMLAQPIEPGLPYVQYRATLRDAEGKDLWSHVFVGARTQLDIPVYLPGRKPGRYQLVLEGAETGDHFDYYNSYSFQLVHP